MIDDVGQMRVQSEGKKSCGPVCRCLRQDRVPQMKFSVRGSRLSGGPAVVEFTPTCDGARPSCMRRTADIRLIHD
jgi:hypothetical protein